MEKIDILGTHITPLSSHQAQAIASRYLSSGGFHQITTVNPDFIMIARKDKAFQEVINQSDLALVDGVGIHLPVFLQGKKLPGRVPGADFTESILAKTEEMGLSLFLLASNRGLSTAQETKKAILKKFPSLTITGCDVDPTSEKDLSHVLSLVKGQVVLANFGAPSQDLFLSRLRDVEFRDIRLVMGVGGTFDFLTGKQKRAPYMVRTFGLEWLWRLLCKPVRRFKRTFNYVVIYSILCISTACAERLPPACCSLPKVLKRFLLVPPPLIKRLSKEPFFYPSMTL